MNKKKKESANRGVTEVVRRVVEELSGSWTEAMEEECLRMKYERHGDLILLTGNALQGDQWISFHGPSLWRAVVSCLRAQRLAVRQRITNDDFRSPQVRLLLSPDDDPWVIHVDNGVKYSFDVTRCMFSAGNITEKIRISQMDCEQEVVLDLYAGIGYFTLPYLVHARAKFVHACEWNPEAAHALRKNLELNKVSARCHIHFGDNRNVALVGVVQRVNLGLIPSSEGGWEVGCRALDPATGGTLHVHTNLTLPGGGVEARAVAYEAEGRRIRDALDAILRKLETGKEWTVTVKEVVKVKSYAPHIHHVVCDILCRTAEEKVEALGMTKSIVGCT